MICLKCKLPMHYQKIRILDKEQKKVFQANQYTCRKCGAKVAEAERVIASDVACSITMADVTL